MTNSGAGTRHRRTQTASLSVDQSLIEIVVTSTGSESSAPPLVPLLSTSTNLDVPPASRDRARSRHRTRLSSTHEHSRGRYKTWLLPVLAGLIVLALVHSAQSSIRVSRQRARILRLNQDREQERLRTETASRILGELAPDPSREADEPFVQTTATARGYLFPVRIAEQESKAEQHLHQLALLAISLNRTLVVPNVGGSRLHACQPFSPSFYYDLDTWAQHFHGKLSVIEQKSWFGIVAGQRDVPVHALRLTQGKKRDADRTSATDLFHWADFCLAGMAEIFDEPQPPWLTLYAPVHYREFDDLELAGFSNGLVSSLSRLDPAPDRSRTDVLLVDYNLRHRVFPSFLPNSTDLTPASPSSLNATSDSTAEGPANSSFDSNVRAPVVAHYDPYPHLRSLASLPERSSTDFFKFEPMPYQALWLDIASSIAQAIQPSIGVHWRMENVPISHLSPCATALARTLAETVSSASRPFEHVYIASDFPFVTVVSSRPPVDNSPASSFSDTFIHLTASHRAAASRLVRLLVEPRSPSFFERWFSSPEPASSTRRIAEVHTLETLLSENSPTFLPTNVSRALAPLDHDLFKLDRGLSGILDKLVLVQTDRFVAGWSDQGFEMCAKRSSFTDSVTTQRRNKLRGREGDTLGDLEEKEAEEEENKAPGREDVVVWFKRPP
ncbi:uncharacterized protein JCM15063_001116 [Sporobolomyces koalae]|uniref:uncharacterized protein n=1 Tax=Sporobolomyces koalae TaxID=500713 RepID=UPI003177BF88